MRHCEGSPKTNARASVQRRSCVGTAPRIALGVVFLLCWTVCGCGLIFNGRRQQVTIRTIPEGATASLAGHEVTTPGQVTLRRKLSWAVLRATKDTYQPACQVVEAPRNRLFIVLDAIPLAIPLVVDIAAGTLRQFPDEIYLDLEPVSPSGKPRALPPDQSILDAWNRSAMK